MIQDSFRLAKTTPINPTCLSCPPLCTYILRNNSVLGAHCATPWTYSQYFITGWMGLLSVKLFKHFGSKCDLACGLWKRWWGRDRFWPHLQWISISSCPNLLVINLRNGRVLSELQWHANQVTSLFRFILWHGFGIWFVGCIFSSWYILSW